MLWRWTFNLYDLNGDGVITKDEMEDIIASVRTSNIHKDRRWRISSINGGGRKQTNYKMCVNIDP